MGSYDIKLPIPDEPLELKREAVEWLRSLGVTEEDPLRNSHLIMWIWNKVAGYLWANWKGILEEYGFNWQKFQKILPISKNSVRKWATGEYLWEKVVSEIEKNMRWRDSLD